MIPKNVINKIEYFLSKFTPEQNKISFIGPFGKETKHVNAFINSLRIALNDNHHNFNYIYQDLKPSGDFSFLYP